MGGRWGRGCPQQPPTHGFKMAITCTCMKLFSNSEVSPTEMDRLYRCICQKMQETSKLPCGMRKVMFNPSNSPMFRQTQTGGVPFPSSPVDDFGTHPEWQSSLSMTANPAHHKGPRTNGVSEDNREHDLTGAFYAGNFRE